jgi:general L-amino acid transport system substrate-binding protein
MIAGLFASLVLQDAALADLTSPVAPKTAPRSTLEKVKAQGFVKCGSVLRPGLAMTNGKGDWSGLEVEICRAVAFAVFGDAARYSYRDYGSALAFDAVRSGDDQVSFLTFAEIAEQKATDKVLPGLPVYIESLDVLVAEPSTTKQFSDLAGKGICFMIGTSAENELEAWFHDHKLEFTPYAFQENGELLDTFNVQRCQGMVGEATYLAGARMDRGVNKLGSRFINDHLASFPILATTPLTDDAQWAAIVTWTVATLINADARETDYHASGLKAMAVANLGLGLPAGWQKTVIDRVGSYSNIFRRSLGAGSPLKIEQGLNRPAADGGALVVPFLD